MKAKKSYGQHFLNNEDISRRIADSLTENGEFHKVLEIGPGKGMLTKYLLEKPYELLVVEADRDMVQYLHQHYPQLKEQIIPADFLKVPLEEFFTDEPFGLIGNFPYNISSQILFKMLDYKEQIPEMVGMFQKEVAERVVAAPGGKIYGVISVLIQAWYEGEYLFTVDKSNFTPPPQVQSGVIRLKRKEQKELGCDEKLFKSIVKQAFSQRRKMLRNTMKSFLKGSPILEDPFFTKRPEKVSVEGFVQLTNWVTEWRG
ncbi:MAG: 16S rRNA (adenine(1518)-N(6)/adenine(1519)-N(6))-dimethyltransferase RsmA [Bacteroidetes bacterium]|nr:MAG: 16S rRNA (adenine(1518)-N(6)/adenine(1519)-N(6))-dimethyltransferase RsmA [Bacteroidota bacterium]